MTTPTYVKKVEVIDRTQIKKITIGTPIRKVIGASVQTLGDLTDVDLTGLTDDHILQYNSTTGRWEGTLLPQTLTIQGGTF